MTTDVGPVGLAASAILVVVAAGLAWRLQLGLVRDIVVACLRAGVQLTLVGYVLVVVVDPDTPIAAAWVWLVLMVGFAAWTVSRRAAELPGITRLAAISLTCSTAVTCLVIFGLGVFPPEARAIVPVGGMMVGNAMTSTVVAGRRVVDELRDKRDEIEARLALGQPWTDASRPMVRDALRVGMTSQIETTKAVGIVFLPGAMTGLILAGVDPLDAVLVQAAIMFLILGAVAINVVVVGTGVARALFTPDHRLLPLPASAKQRPARR